MKENKDELDDLDIPPLVILLLVLVMCGFLVALYFFYDYLGKRLVIQLFFSLLLQKELIVTWQ